MASRKMNGRATRVAPQFDSQLVLSQAQSVSTAAGAISRVTEEVAEGSDVHGRTLERATGSLKETAACCYETAGGGVSVGASTEQMVAAVNESAASVEQVTANPAALAEFLS